MPTITRRKPAPDPGLDLRVDHPQLTAGNLFRVHGCQGVFSFLHVWAPDSSIAAFGPIGSARARHRSFRPEAFKARDLRAERAAAREAAESVERRTARKAGR